MGPQLDVDAFGAYLRRLQLATRTVEQYSDCGRHFLKFLGQRGWSVEALPREVLVQYAENLVSHYKPRSVRVYLSAANRYLRFLETRGIPGPQSMLRPQDLPKIATEAPDALTTQHLAEYFDEMDRLEEPLRTSATLLPLTGLRITEMVTLKLDAVSSVAMRYEGTVVTATTFKVLGKGNRPRTLVMLPQGRESFLAYLNGWRLSMPTDWLWPSSRGAHISDRWLREAVYKAEARIGGRITPHTMRRTYITSLWRGGIDVATIAKMSGHSVSTLMRCYLAPTKEDLARLVHSKMGDETWPSHE